MRCSHCSMPVKPIVSFDIDGTLGDYHGHFANFAQGYLGRSLPRDFPGGDFSEYLRIDKGTYRQIKLAYRQGGMKRTMPAYNRMGHIVQLAKEWGCEVWLMTTRPYLRLDNVDPDTRFW